MDSSQRRLGRCAAYSLLRVGGLWTAISVHGVSPNLSA